MGANGVARFAVERQMGLRRGPTAHPFGCEAIPKAAPSIRLLVLGAAGVLVCVMLLTGWLLWDARRVALEYATQSRDNVAAAIEHDVERTVELFDLSLQAVIDGLRSPGIGSASAEIRNPLLFDGSATARHLGSTMVLDDKGQVTIDSRQATPLDRNFADRDFFRVHRDQRQAGLYTATFPPERAVPGPSSTSARSAAGRRPAAIAPTDRHRTSLPDVSPLSRRYDHPS